MNAIEDLVQNESFVALYYSFSSSCGEGPWQWSTQNRYKLKNKILYGARTAGEFLLRSQEKICKITFSHWTLEGILFTMR